MAWWHIIRVLGGFRMIPWLFASIGSRRKRLLLGGQLSSGQKAVGGHSFPDYHLGVRLFRRCLVNGNGVGSRDESN